MVDVFENILLVLLHSLLEVPLLPRLFVVLNWLSLSKLFCCLTFGEQRVIIIEAGL